MEYRCENSSCGWTGENPDTFEDSDGGDGKGGQVVLIRHSCPRCGGNALLEAVDAQLRFLTRCVRRLRTLRGAIHEI
jgi:hypothetical protein